ncbi:lethal(3)malignant brain tumor-like protein 1 isoform X2 [Culicoides brevitarsis]|uniref:lethal(3)malignant brain tumor-like protein 1 isoform X2 n=1 Tax=Culicoides brevitarsis TaxID=469753 RepID=UPI00307BC7A9
MPRKCYILNCDSNSNKSSKYTPIFSFPKERERRAQWIEIVRQQFPELGDQDPGVNASVCIHHFDPSLVERHITHGEGKGETKSKLKLKKEAVPTIWTTDNDQRPVPKITKFKQRVRRLSRKSDISPPKKLKSPPHKHPSTNNLPKMNNEAIRLNVIQDYVKDYGPIYHETRWNKNCRVLKLSVNNEENPLNWSVETVGNYVSSVCSVDIGELFKEQEVDGNAFLDLTKDDLLQLMCIKLGPAIKIATLIKKLRNEICEKFIVCENEGAM